MLVDVHCHLTDNYFNDNIEYIIKKSVENNVEAIITAGLNSIDNRRVLELSKKYDIVKASLGFYPIDAILAKEENIEEEIEFIKRNNKKIIAISEVGLDYYMSENKIKQKVIFQKFIDLSEKISKPIIVHSRKAELDVVNMLESSKLKKVIFHSFTGNKNLIKRIIDNNWHFSIPPIILRSSNFQTLARISPLTQLLTETDSPYQSPYRNEKNQPVFVKESIKKISEIKNIEILETKNIVFMNFKKIFRKWKTI